MTHVAWPWTLPHGTYMLRFCENPLERQVDLAKILKFLLPNPSAVKQTADIKYAIALSSTPLRCQANHRDVKHAIALSSTPFALGVGKKTGRWAKVTIKVSLLCFC